MYVAFPSSDSISAPSVFALIKLFPFAITQTQNIHAQLASSVVRRLCMRMHFSRVQSAYVQVTRPAGYFFLSIFFSRIRFTGSAAHCRERRNYFRRYYSRRDAMMMVFFCLTVCMCKNNVRRQSAVIERRPKSRELNERLQRDWNKAAVQGLGAFLNEFVTDLLICERCRVSNIIRQGYSSLVQIIGMSEKLRF